MVALFCYDDIVSVGAPLSGDACVWVLVFGRLCGDTCVLVIVFCRFCGGVFVEVLVSGRYWVCYVIVSVLLLCRLCYCVVWLFRQDVIVGALLCLVCYCVETIVWCSLRGGTCVGYFVWGVLLW